MGAELALAFAAGLVSFVTPCVLPLVPGYLSVISGVDAGTVAKGDAAPGRMLRATLPFVLGFVVTFALAGGAAAFVGGGLGPYRTVLTELGGLVIVIMGLVLLELVPGLDFERLSMGAPGRWARRSPILLGAAFAICFVPCVGPTLGAILVLAAGRSTVLEGMALLVAYGVGLAVPFVLVAVAYGRTMGSFKALRDHDRAIRMVSGCILVVVGLLVFFDRMWWVNAWVNRALHAVGLGALPQL